MLTRAPHPGAEGVALRVRLEGVCLDVGGEVYLAELGLELAPGEAVALEVPACLSWARSESRCSVAYSDLRGFAGSAARGDRCSLPAQPFMTKNFSPPILDILHANHADPQ